MIGTLLPNDSLNGGQPQLIDLPYLLNNLQEQLIREKCHSQKKTSLVGILPSHEPLNWELFVLQNSPSLRISVLIFVRCNRRGFPGVVHWFPYSSIVKYHTFLVFIFFKKTTFQRSWLVIQEKSF